MRNIEVKFLAVINLILYLLLALVVSFLCSILESVLLSAPQAYLRTRAEAGDKIATALGKMKQVIDRPLSAILSMNTVAHTIGAAGVGAQAVKVFGEAYFGVISAILTILILVLTEIIPKTVGASYWKNLLGFTLYSIRIMIVITWPLVWISAFITRLFSKKRNEKTISREELGLLADIGMQEGVLGEQESRIINNIISLRKVKIWDIMTPRVVVAAVEQDTRIEDFAEMDELKAFTRIPVYSGSIENVTGYVFRQDVFELLADDKHGTLVKALKREIIVVPESIPALRAWDRMIQQREHIALVVDEYGGTAGIITMEDIIETLLGFEIMDEKDSISDMQEFARNKYISRRARNEKS